ncbi:hypothetical protein GCM10009641_33290 [Mycobacterium cookii]|uniref:PIN domain-containing protein n=1 Tax=Nocardioides furvisabuli TaxID=375542 RepID=UPI001E388DF5|nr:hypothetical protein [Nocardioides furvisabuli]
MADIGSAAKATVKVAKAAGGWPLLAEVAADFAAQAAVRLLKDRTVRQRVAKSASRAAEDKGIVITAGSLAQWLERDDVQDLLATGTEQGVHSAIDQLKWLIVGHDDTLDQKARDLLTIVLAEFLIAQDPATAISYQHTWLRGFIGRQTEEIVEAIEASRDSILEAVSDVNTYPVALRKLHPWRNDTGRELAEEWPPLIGLVQALAAANDRSQVLTDWSLHPPEQLETANTRVWEWLAQVAQDYGAGEAACTFYERAVDLGGSPRGLLYARAAHSVASTNLSRAREVLDKALDHPLGRALQALWDDDLRAGIVALEDWTVTTPSEVAMKAGLLARAQAPESINHAVATARTALESTQHASGLALIAAELLLQRAKFGGSVWPSADASEAFDLAVRSRNGRRQWSGDVVAAVRVAITASALMHDLNRGYQLTRTPPSGDALPNEAEDPFVKQQAAVLAAMTGRREDAALLAQASGDEYAIATVAGMEALYAHDDETAMAAWTRAYTAAPDNLARVQTALMMVGGDVELPDLSEVETEYPDQVAEVRALDALPRDRDERLAILRNGALNDRLMAVTLAGMYNDEEDYRRSGETMTTAGERWSDPSLMRMGSAQLLRAGDVEEARQAAEAALDLGGPQWGGEIETRKLLFTIHEQLNEPASSIRQLQTLITLDPNDDAHRWTYVRCLVRQGDVDDAWDALRPDGDPIDPSDAEDAALWAKLITRFDVDFRYLRRILNEMERWRDDSDALGSLVAQLYFWLQRNGVQPSSEDETTIRAAIDDYVNRFPENPHLFAAPVADLQAQLQEQARSQFESLQAIRGEVAGGPLPPGLLGQVYNLPHAAAALLKLEGWTLSHDPTRDNSSDVDAALDKVVAVDLSAIATLSALGPALSASLTSAFQRMDSTEIDFLDTLNTREIFELGMAQVIVWDPGSESASLMQPSQKQSEQLLAQAMQMTILLSAARRHAVREFRALSSHRLAETPWLATMDHAAHTGIPFWSDDVGVQQLAREHGLFTFGSFDLATRLASAGRIAPDLAVAIRAGLVRDHHVDLGFDRDAMSLAGDLDGWAPGGLATSLARARTWMDGEQALSFLMQALSRPENHVPDRLFRWMASSATGLTSGLVAEQASSNLRVLLRITASQPWVTAELFVTILDGVRVGLRRSDEITDPLRPVLSEFWKALLERLDHAGAKAVLLERMKFCSEQDRQCAVAVVLAP